MHKRRTSRKKRASVLLADVCKICNTLSCLKLVDARLEYFLRHPDTQAGVITLWSSTKTGRPKEKECENLQRRSSRPLECSAHLHGSNNTFCEIHHH